MLTTKRGEVMLNQALADVVTEKLYTEESRGHFVALIVCVSQHKDCRYVAVPNVWNVFEENKR